MKKSSLFFTLGLLVQAIVFFGSAAWASCESDEEANIASYAATCGMTTCGPSSGVYTKFSIESSDSGDGQIRHYAVCSTYSCPTNEFWGGSGFGIGACGGPNPVSNKGVQDFIKPKIMCGSVIQSEAQTIGESIPIVGSDITLNYFSNWVTGRGADYTLVAPLAGDTPRDAILSFDIELKLGTTTVETVHYTNNQANLSYSYVWNGLDSSSNPTLGSQKYDLVVTENYASISLPLASSVDLGSFKAKLIGLGGWVPNLFSFYDSSAKKLYNGDGSIRNVTASAVSGGGYWIASEDGSTVSYFDSLGRIISKKTGLLGTTLYTFNYDTSGNLTSIVEPFSRTTTFGRSGGNFASITAPKGQVTTVSLDTNGYLASVTNPNSEVYALTYWSAGGLLKTFTKPQGQVSTFTYNTDGTLSNESKSSGYFFDLVKNLNTGYNAEVVKTTPLGRETKVQTNSGSKVVSRTTTYSTTAQETYTYSGLTNGYGTESSYSSGVTTSNNYQSDARFGDMSQFASQNSVSFGSVSYYVTNTQSVTLSTPSDPFSISAMSLTSQKGNLALTTNYTPSTKTFDTSSSLGRTSQAQIDSYERVISSKRGNLTQIDLTYTNEHLTKIAQGTRETNFAYSSTGFLSTITNPLSQVTGFTYDSAGRVYSKTLPDLRVIAYSYDSNGNISGITPPGRTIHSFGLNADELPSSYAPPTLSGVATVNTTYSYNDDKQLTQILKPTGDSIDFTYDSTTGLLQNFVAPAGTYTVWMNAGNSLPSTIAAPSGPTTYITYAGTTPTQYMIYDSSSNYVSTYVMDLSSNATLGSDTVTTPVESDQIYYTYDDDELLTGAGDLTLTNDTPNGMLTATSIGTSPNIVTDSYTYNSFGEVTGYQAKYGTTVIYDLTLGRDGMGRINSKTQVMNSVTDAYGYTFDTTGRLTQTTKNSSTVATYGYDDNSNRNSGTIGAQTTTATYDAQDRMTAYNLLSFTYNANGDLTSRTNTLTSTTTSYTYDVFGNLTSVTLPSTDVIDYEIDGLNRRIGKKINGVLQKRWVYMDQTRIAAELDSSGNIDKRFIYASKGNIPDYMIMGGENYRIISDHLGSPRLVVKVSDGTVAGRMDHDEYGRVTVNTNPGLLPFGFAGGLYDTDTGLVRFGARDYDSETGRWTSKDPILFGGGDTNLFGYTFQDPVNIIDPSGMDCSMDQSSGKAICYDHQGNISQIYNGYSGKGAGTNNPQMEGIHKVGPVPVGSYIVMGEKQVPGRSFQGRMLMPAAGTLLSFPGNRQPFSFYIHGDNSSHTASEGCYIMNKDGRDKIKTGEYFNVINLPL